jgi:hypothetical protein
MALASLKRRSKMADNIFAMAFVEELENARREPIFFSDIKLMEIILW